MSRASRKLGLVGVLAACLVAVLLVVVWSEPGGNPGLSTGATPAKSGGTAGAAGTDAKPNAEADASANPITTRVRAPDPSDPSTLPTVVVRGRIVESGGGVVNGARVFLQAGEVRENRVSGFRRGDYYDDTDPAIAADPAPLAETASDRDGRFELPAVANRGPFIVRVLHDAFLDWASETQEPAVTTLELGDVVLDRGAAVSGIVLGPDGEPIAAALVACTIVGNLLERKPWLAVWKRTPRRPIRTDDSGRFRVTGEPPTQHSFTARKRGFPPKGVDLALVAGEEIRDVVIQLERGFELPCVVHDSAGAPIRGAELDLEVQGPQYKTGYPRVESGDDGRCTLTGIPAGKWQLSVWAEGFVDTEIEAVAIPAIAPVAVVLQLQAVARVAGSVRMVGSEKAIHDVHVTIGDADWDAWTNVGFDDDSVAGHDGDGAYLLEGVQPGRFRVYARAAGAQVGRSDPFEVRGGEAITGIDLLLEPAPRIVGRVVTASDHTPVAAAKLHLLSADDDEECLHGVLRGRNAARRESARMMFDVLGRTVKSGEDGRFELDHLGPGAWQVHVDDPRFAPIGIAGLVLEPGECHDLGDLVVGAGGTVEGTVIDERGEPVVSETIELQSLALAGVWFHTETGRAGEYRIEKVPAGAALVRRVDDVMRQEARWSGSLGVDDLRERLARGKRIALVEGATVRVDFRDDENPWLEGWVTRAGKAVAAALVMAGPVDEARDFLPFTAVRKVHTDDAGHWKMSGIQAGRWMVAASSAPAPALTHRLVSVPASGALRVDLQLDGGTLEGIVVREADSAPLASAVLHLEATTADGARRPATWLASLTTLTSDAAEVELTTDTAGHFRIDGVPPGFWCVVASCDLQVAQASPPLRVVAAEVAPSIVIRMATAGALRVLVRNPKTHRAIANAGVAITSGETTRELRTDSDGVGEFDALHAGGWSVVVTTLDGKSPARSTTVVVEPGQMTEHTFDE